MTREEFIKKYSLPDDTKLAQFDFKAAVDIFSPYTGFRKIDGQWIFESPGFPTLQEHYKKDCTCTEICFCDVRFASIRGQLAPVYEMMADLKTIETPVAKKKSLDALEIPKGSYVIRPNGMSGEMHTGRVIKVGTMLFDRERGSDGEEWKSLVETEAILDTCVAVGELLYYSYKYEFHVDGEPLHLITSFHMKAKS